MKQFGLGAVAILCSFFLWSGTSFAQEQNPIQAEQTQRVVVTGALTEHEEKSYEDMANAVNRFESYHATHPDTKLRFRIYARKEGVNMKQVKVYVIDEDTQERWPVFLDADASFALPEIPERMRKTARVHTNADSGQLAWQVRITRDNAQPGLRYLGDLREECRLEFSAARLRRGVVPAALIALQGQDDVCMRKNLTFFDIGEEAIFAVHLNYKDRKYSLLSDSLHDSGSPGIYHSLLDWTYALRDRTYRPPIWDTSWPDETEVHLVYVTDHAQMAGQS